MRGSMKKVTLAECPVGLFLSEAGTLCLKTEYSGNNGRIDAYIVPSGEFFWGGTNAPKYQRAVLVTPVLHAEVERLRADADRYQYLRNRPDETIGKGGIFAGMTPTSGSGGFILNGEDLDRAVDAAIATERPEACTCNEAVDSCAVHGFGPEGRPDRGA